MRFSTANLRAVFAEEGKYNEFRQLCFNLVRGNDIYEVDDNGTERHISAGQANRAVRKVFLEVLGLSEEDAKSTKKRRRAIKRHGQEIFEIIEEDIDFRVNEGFLTNEWFNEWVDERNLSLGDANEFVSPDKSYLVVADVSRSNHDITMQQLGEGETMMIPTKTKGIKVGKDIDLIILGRIDYTRLIDKISEAFIQDIQKTVYTAVSGASAKLPSSSEFVKTGVLGSATKEGFDDLIQKVMTANGSDAVIMGTRVALKKITALADVNWASHGQKDSIAATGRLGAYEGTTLVEIPQRFKAGTLTNLIDDNVLLIMPTIEDKFVKFVDEGETEIIEITERGDLVDDFQTYEIVRTYGAGVILGQYFGVWKFV